MQKSAVFIVSALFILTPLLGFSAAEAADGKALLIKGKHALDSGKYAEAVESLLEAQKEMPVVGDYIVFWIATAYREMGNFSESTNQIKELFKSYPYTPLKKQARAMEIRNIISSVGGADDVQVFETYVKDYPDDKEIKFILAQIFKNKGETEKAKKIFKNLYAGGNDLFAKMSYDELSPSDIDLYDLIEKSENLTACMAFKEAESMLRSALLKDNGQRMNELLKKLGYALSRQKKYKEAAEAYEKAGDYFSTAKALYAAGEKAAFDLALKKLTLMGDKRTGALLMLTAEEKRRNNEIADALHIYKDVKSNYPFEAENALWGIGWTNYRMGEYQIAFDAFSELYGVYGNSKYLYWKARSMEKMGRDADHIYRKLAEKQLDFYTALAHIKTKPGLNEKIITKETEYPELEPDMPQALTAQESNPKTLSSERIDILIELGLKKEAATELSAMAKKATNLDELLAVSLKLQDAGEYKSAMLLASRFPYKDAVHKILYPLAHWPAVKEASITYSVDPFIVLSVMREESHFDPGARSVAGALGLMQLMPQTAYRLEKKINLDIKSHEQIHDIQTNISLGSYYLNFLLKEFGSLPEAVAAYNAGENAVRKWQKSGNYTSLDEFVEDIPYNETRNYAKRVITTYLEYYRRSAGENSAPRIL